MRGYLIAAGVLLAVGVAVAVAAPRPKIPTTPVYRSVSVSLKVDEGSIPGLCRRLCSTGPGLTSTVDWSPGDPVTTSGDRRWDAHRRGQAVQP